MRTNIHYAQLEYESYWGKSCYLSEVEKVHSNAFEEDELPQSLTFLDTKRGKQGAKELLQAVCPHSSQTPSLSIC